MRNDELNCWRRRVALTMSIADILAKGERVWLIQRNGRLSLLSDGPRIIGEDHPYAESNGLGR